MSVTLADVAKATGLSASTVSRALSDPDKVNPSTRERVRKIARDMGYVPNLLARSLTAGRNDIVGLIVPDIANPFFPPIIKAVQARATSKGKTVLIADVDEHPADELHRARVMRKRVDGLIVVSPRTPDDQLAALAELRPIVFVNRELPGTASVIIENSDGMREAVEHLTALGHRRIGYLNGPRRSWSNIQRQNAVRQACADQGAELVEFGPFEPQIQAGVRAADLVHASGMTAVIAYDDMIALGLMARLNERGIRVGPDISVIGIDDSPMSGMAYPTLTSIHVPGAEAGAAAVDIVLDLADAPDDAPPPVRQLETRLIVRGSTSPVPG
ncbi:MULTISPECIES: LacI family DNA-binding transcriptional regulator [Actinoalloteichus]|uniref:Transcriptional regulator, LacI family n=1 Tax=Actinoalloteichus fjordicus TaxID=1612552 RepID=A0AAC9LFJ2_9PSEU|nr:MULTISPECIES: LacI family DNA-binding transcriptional regulator [Actinoalloteichus]APU16451.1 transcriptional regulator, LacI family [Actinoalloteichus fjordicus]APU22510.1 transcriptional regulator, LacI family [Actinoalloteichus sp. GBA129-24]